MTALPNWSNDRTASPTAAFRPELPFVRTPHTPASRSIAVIQPGSVQWQTSVQDCLHLIWASFLRSEEFPSMAGYPKRTPSACPRALQRVRW